MRVKASILGHFGEGENLLNGQTIKTKTITEELQSQIGREQVLKIDTHGGLKTFLKAPFQVFRALKNSNNILIFPAHNGLRVFAPLLSFQKRFFKKRKIHYIVIGGWLPKFLLKRKNLAKTLKNFDYIYVETYTMKDALETQGFDNVYVMPNCKKLTILSEKEIVDHLESPYKLCTFSRVMKEKGIETAVSVIKQVNDKLGYTAYSLDIYGQVDVAQTEWFENLKFQFPEYVNYCGCVDANQSVTVLKEYFALLFPTYYEGEGFAGTLIDAYSAGVPVIASDWKYNSELVNEDVGYVYPTEDQEAFVSILEEIVMNPYMILSKKRLCLKEAEKYKIDKVIQILVQHMEDK